MDANLWVQNAQECLEDPYQEKPWVQRLVQPMKGGTDDGLCKRQSSTILPYLATRKPN
jgi:hypothetical protein